VDLCAEGETLARMIVDAYLSRDHLDDLDGSCPLIALPSDTARGGTAVKVAYRQVLDMMVGVFTDALSGPKGRQQALALTSLCVGAMAIARAIDDPALADEFRGAAHDHVLHAQGWATPPPS
jgi:TetR/AcrR family transcriptional repressor of nem operon